MSTVGTAREMRHRIRVRYGRHTEGIAVPQHLVAFEVPIDGRPRWAQRPERRSRQRIDAVAVGLWASTKHLIHGFEIKVTRADLLAELRDPAKAEHAARAVDRWWLALGDPALLRDGDDLPAGWGVLAVRGRGLGVVVEPQPMPGVCDRRIMAGILQASLRSHGTCRASGYVEGWARAERAYLRGLRP